MYTIKEEIYIIFYLLVFGIYLFSTLDIITILTKKITKKSFRIIIQILFWLAQIYITFIFSYHLMDGYIPIYFILFIYLGYFIYEKLLKKCFRKTIILLLKVLKVISRFIIKLTKPLLYSKKLFQTIFHFFKREWKIIKTKLFKKKTKVEEEII